MINGHEFYVVLSAMMPLYVAMILAYGSVRWWKIFTPEQCAGINRFVAVFAVPLLSFHFISRNDPYAMDLRFIAADSLQKIIMLVALIFWASFAKHGSLDWLITIFTLSTLPNTLVMGIPLLVAMYGEYCRSLMVQIVVLQCIVWYTLLLFMYEFRAAKMLIAEKFPDTAGSIRSVNVNSDVISLDGNEGLETDTTIGGDGKLHVTVRKSNASMSRRSDASPRPSSLSEVAIYSNQSPRSSSFDPAEFCAMTGAQSYSKRNSSFGHLDLYPPFKSSSPRTSNFSEARLCHTSTKPQQTDLSTNEVRLSVSVNPETRAEPKAGSTGSAIGHSGTDKRMPPGSVMTRLIMVMVWRKLIRNPNTYSSLIGLIWSLIHFRWHIEMPVIIDKSITILSDTGLGMAMFTLGLFMALQPSLIPCGKAPATYAMAVRFITGPAVMAAASLILGIRGELLRVAILQAALPQAIVPFVFATEYKVHPQILSTAVIFGMMIALPITLIYYILLGL